MIWKDGKRLIVLLPIIIFKNKNSERDRNNDIIILAVYNRPLQADILS